ncbi:MAG TPA: tetratricopeptide repeat protein [Steroidobacteraceae bacterium]|jgi:tetratricopeptide (TPR) repeat protein|nr:tetratricopeptide repeat protein [Steroidobacteraceae bacterium]
MRAVGAQLQAGQFRAAHDRLEAIVAANPAFAEAQRLLAGTKLALGDAAAAEALLRRALEVDPDWAPTYTTLGELLLAGGRGAEAEAVLLRAIVGARSDPRAALVLARYYNDTARPAEALRVAAPFCGAGKADPELATQHVNALIALGRHTEAIALYGNLAAAAPDDLAPAQPLAIALDAAGRHEEAAQIAHRALTRGFRSATLCLTYAKALMAAGANDRAETALRDCLRLEPRLAEAHNSLAQVVWIRTGDLAQATAALDQALHRFGDDDALWATKAAVLQGAGDARGAYECLAPRVDRAHAPPALLVRAGLSALDFDPATALSLGERASSAMPESAPARALLTAAQLGMGDAHQALGNCEILLAHAPDNQYFIALQTTALRLLGDARYQQLCDYRRLILPLDISPPPPWRDLPGFLADLTASLDRVHDPKGHALLFQSLRHGTETTRDLTRSTDRAVRGLFEAFVQPIARYLEHIGEGTDSLRRRNEGRWRFNGSWSVRLRDHGFHMSHVHPRGWISSAFYVALPDVMADTGTDEGVLSFGKPGILTTPLLEPEYTIRPTPGMLVLFPSYFWHGTIPFQSRQPRLTVAFDVVPAK